MATNELAETGGEGRGAPGRGGDSVWLRAEVDRPRRPAPLTRERIIDEAIALLDELGIDGVTMRRLAQRLSVTPTALYWHVTTKDDVLDLAVDQIFGEVRLPEPTADWRAGVRGLVRGWRTAMLDHPWAPGLVGRPMLGPNVLARTEFLQAALARGGFRDRALAVLTRLVANYVIGAALTEAAWRRSADPDERVRSRRRIAENAAMYPTLTESGHLDQERWDDDELFDRGLDVLLEVAPDRPPTSMGVP